MAVLIFKQGNYTETGSLAYAEPIFFTDANTLIISGGVSTYTNTEVTPSISAGRVGYRVATIDSINTGSFLVSGDVSASNLFLDGNATVRGNITMGGSGLDFGDASDDNVVFKADISSSFIPNNDDSFDLGSDSQRWKTAYFSNLNLSGSLYVIGGPIDLHSDTYISASAGTFLSASIGTHAVVNVGSNLDLDVGGNTTFDGQGTLSVSSSGALKIDSPTSIGVGTNSDAPIDIDASTLDIDASSTITIDSTANIAIAAGTTASLDGEEAIHIGLEERVPVRMEGNSVTINGSANVDVDADGGKLTLDGSTGIDIGVEADVPIDVDSSTLDIDASGAITISGSGVFDVNAAGALTLDSDTSISIGTDKDKPIDIDASTFDVDASGAITINGESTTAISSSGTLSIDSETGINIGTTTDKPIDIDSTTLDIDSSGAITINGESTTAISSSGTLSIDSETGINIGTTTDKPIDIDSTTLDIDASSHITISGSGASNIDIDAGGNIRVDAGTGMFIGTAQDVPIDIDSTTLDIDASGAVTVDSTSTISLDGVGNSNFTTDSGTLTISNTTSGDMTVLSAGNIDIDAGGGKISIDGTGGIDIGVETDVAIDVDSSTFDLDASGNITLDSTGEIYIGTATSGVPISIGHTTSETTINDNLTVTGNFTVNGTTTYVSSSNVTIGDRIIELNYLGTTGNGGIYVGDADGTTTSGSLLWDSTNDYWIAGQKDLEHKILISNGDSVISGSGVNNQVALFDATHGLDSDGNFTFDGSTLRINGSQEITEQISGSSTASFAALAVTGDASIASLTVTDLTNDRLVVVGGGGELEDDNNLRWNGTSLAITGNVEATASGSFKDIKVTDNVTVDGVVRTERLNVTSSENILATFESTDAAAKIVLKDVNGEGARFSYLGSTDTVGIGQSNTHNEMAIHIDNNERVAIGSNHTIPHAVLDVSGSLIVSGTQEIKFGDLTVYETGSFGKVSGDILATNGVVSGSIQVDHDSTTGFVANEHIDHTSVSISAGSGLSGGGNISSSRTLTLDTGSTHFTNAVNETIDTIGVLSGSLNAGSNVTINEVGGNYFISSSGGGGGGSVGTLAQVTALGSTTADDIAVGNGTDSTSKTTGALIVSGGLGVLNTINAGGDVIAYASSDERLKDNIKPIENPLDKISQISGNTFDWNSEKQNIYNGKDYGVIAQEIQKVMPELVDTRDSGYLAVKYDKIVPLLIESIKELKKQIEELKSK